MYGARVSFFLILFEVILSTTGQGNPGDVQVFDYNNVNNGADGYRFSYSLDDGTRRYETGEFVNGVWTVTGLVVWYSPDKQKYVYSYRADDKGVVWTPVKSAPKAPLAGVPSVPFPAAPAGGVPESGVLGSSTLASLAGVG